jgi:hypothetical protein
VMKKFLASVCAAALIAGPAFAQQAGPQPFTPIATTTFPGKVQPDGSTITITAAGVISSSGGGSGCTVSGTVNQTVSNNGSSGCQSDATTITTGGTIVDPANGAASSPALLLTGAVATGSGTTSWPLLYVNPGSTATTTLSTSGTLIGAQAAGGFGGNLLDMQSGGTDEFKVAGNGTVTIGGSVTLGNNSGGSTLEISGRVFLSTPASATLQLGATDAASPVAQTLQVQNVVAGTSNTAGAAMLINGSKGTGTGVGGSITIQTASAGTTGSAQNALSPALTLDTTQFAILGSGTPTCGTGCASIAAGATNQRMVMTTGTAQTSAAVAFSKTLTTPPVCVATQQSATPVGMGFSAISTSGFTLTFLSALTAGVVDVICQ